MNPTSAAQTAFRHTRPSGRMIPAGATDESHGRRTERRVACRLPCHLILPIDSQQKLTTTGETVNASADGIAVQVGLPLERGSTVEVLLSSARTRMRGEVVHSRRVASGTYQVGIRLLDRSGIG